MFYPGPYIKKDPDLLSVIEAFEKQYGIPGNTRFPGDGEWLDDRDFPDSW